MPKYYLLAILLLATLIRFFMLGKVPASLNWDEVSMGYSAYSLASTGADEWGERYPLFFRSYGEWKSAVYIYLLLPLIKLFGLTAFVVRLPSALFGVISVYLLYLLGRQLYSHKVGLWAAFLMAVTPWSFFLSRPAFEANVALTLSLSGIYFFLKIFTSHASRFTPYLMATLSAISFGLAPHTYNSAKLVVPLLVIYLLYATKLYRSLKLTALILAILTLFALPILSNISSGYSQARYNQVSLTTDGEELAKFYALRSTIPLPDPLGKLMINRATFVAYHFLDNYLLYFSPSFLTWSGGTHTQQSLPYRGVLYLTQLYLVIMGSAIVLRAKSKRFPLVLIALGLIPAALTRDPLHVLRSIHAVPGFVLLSAIGIDYLSSHNRPVFRWVLPILIAEILVFMTLYFTWYPKAYARDWQYGHAEVASYLSSHSDEYDQIVMTKWYGEPQLFLAFYGQWDPAVFQAENLSNLRYEREGKMWLDQLPEYHLGKYTFKYLDWQHETRDSNTLYIGKADDFYPDTPVLDTIYYPDGQPVFVIVQGDK